MQQIACCPEYSTADADGILASLVFHQSFAVLNVILPLLWSTEIDILD